MAVEEREPQRFLSDLHNQFTGSQLQFVVRIPDFKGGIHPIILNDRPRLIRQEYTLRRNPDSDKIRGKDQNANQRRSRLECHSVLFGRV
jgi:hypothetical protein